MNKWSPTKCRLMEKVKISLILDKKEEPLQKLIQLDVIGQASVSFSAKTFKNMCTLFGTGQESRNTQLWKTFTSSKFQSAISDLNFPRIKLQGLFKRWLYFPGVLTDQILLQKVSVWWLGHKIFIHTFITGSKWKEVSVWSRSVVDPGFPQGGGANSPGGHQHMNLPNFPKKLHEIERIWTPRWGTSKILLCRSATDDGVLITVTWSSEVVQCFPSSCSVKISY